MPPKLIESQPGKVGKKSKAGAAPAKAAKKAAAKATSSPNALRSGKTRPFAQELDRKLTSHFPGCGPLELDKTWVEGQSLRQRVEKTMLELAKTKTKIGPSKWAQWRRQYNIPSRADELQVLDPAQSCCASYLKALPLCCLLLVAPVCCLLLAA